MGAKELVIRPLASADATAMIRRLHYSGKVKNNSQVHMGVYWREKCCGALQFGPPNDRSKMLGLVEGSRWSDVIELNRMAFSEALPRNSESRALSVAFRILRKKYPHLKWVISFADATQCGDGAIYRASGFSLTGIKRSTNLARLPDGSVIHKLALNTVATIPRPELGGRSFFDVTGGKYDFAAYCKAAGAVVLEGHQLRYIYFLDRACRARLTVPEIPFSKIAEMGATMYRGERPPGAGSVGSDTLTPPGEKGRGSTDLGAPTTSGGPSDKGAV